MVFIRIDSASTNFREEFNGGLTGFSYANSQLAFWTLFTKHNLWYFLDMWQSTNPRGYFFLIILKYELKKASN